jgi:hypothetical protein
VILRMLSVLRLNNCDQAMFCLLDLNGAHAGQCEEDTAVNGSRRSTEAGTEAGGLL